MSCTGAFHGMIAPTTPTGSRTRRPKPGPDGCACSSNGNVSASAAYDSKPLAAIIPEYWAMLCNVPDSRGHSSPSASLRSMSAAAKARMYSARSAWVSVGHGPSSNAVRAASTARAMSAACASATLKATSSVPASMTSIWASDDGATHAPPMKKVSGWAIGMVVERAMAVSSCSRERTDASPLLPLALLVRDDHARATPEPEEGELLASDGFEDLEAR